MGSGYPEPPRELDDLSVPAITVDRDASGSRDSDTDTDTRATNSRGGFRYQPYIPNATEKPRVRFDNGENSTPEAETQRGGNPRKLRPALASNPNSYGSASGDLSQEPLSVDNVLSAAAAAQRARIAAMDAQYGPHVSSSRWSTESEVPMAQSYTSPHARGDESLSANLEAEAEGLLHAHTQNLQASLRDHHGRFHPSSA